MFLSTVPVGSIAAGAGGGALPEINGEMTLAMRMVFLSLWFLLLLRSRTASAIRPADARGGRRNVVGHPRARPRKGWRRRPRPAVARSRRPPRHATPRRGNRSVPAAQKAEGGDRAACPPACRPPCAPPDAPRRRAPPAALRRGGPRRQPRTGCHEPREELLAPRPASAS